MGLDMYLFKNKNDYDELIYWRKSNSIQGWFDENIKGGVENGVRHKISKSKIDKLIKCLKEDIEYLQSLHLNYDTNEFISLDKDKLNLKPTQGFFFGSYNVDLYYLDDIKSSLVALETLDDSIKTFYYCGDW